MAGRALSHPFRVQHDAVFKPRALPWAMFSDSFGVNSRNGRGIATQRTKGDTS
jgi:hypothetical protein